MAEPRLSQIQENLLSGSRPVEDSDLFAFLLRGALPQSSLKPTAEAFLQALGGLRGLAEFNNERAQALKVDDRSAGLLLAVAELARRRPLWETRFTACQAIGIELVDYRILGTFFVSLRNTFP